MPTYQYRCGRCGHEFELFQSITEKPKSRCPKCRGKVVRLLGTGAGLIFKGSGFYQTDYRSEGYKSRAKEESGGGDAGKGKGDSSGPAKGEPSKDAKKSKESKPQSAKET
jgi:putative FmdB family regulatory protein